MPDALRRQAVVLAVLLISALIVLVLYLWSPASERSEAVDGAVRVDVTRVMYQARTLPVVLEGIAAAADQIAVVAEVSGTVVKRPEVFRDGGVVAAGDLLLAVDAQNYQLALAERSSQVSAARLHLADTRARASVARRVNGNNDNAYARLEPHLEEAEARLAAAEAGLKRAQMDLAKTRVVAPFHGRLREVRASPGQFIRAGEVIATLSSTDRIEVRLPVRDEWLALLDLPLQHDAPITPIPARLHGRFAGRDVVWQGELVRREGGLNQNRMLYLVVQVIDADSNPVPLEPGVLVRAEIEGRYQERIASLPRSVLSGDRNVWVVDDEQRLRRRQVQVVHQDDSRVYVGSGLQDGDRVALSGALRWLEGSRIMPREQQISAAMLRAESGQ
jgi:RND family efflux transporter MFP subunit